MFSVNTLPITLAVPETVGESLELCRLLAAATVSPHFENLLLNDPRQALEQGYEDESFLLSPGERELILSLHAPSLAELAGILVRTLGQRETVPSYSHARLEPSILE